MSSIFQPRRAFMTLAGLLLASPAAVHAEEPVRFSAEFSAGVIADSDVGLADLDLATSEGDVASLLGLKLDAEVTPASRLTLRAGYELSDTRYQDFDAFNLQMHRLSGEGEYEFGNTRAGLLYNYVDARVAGDKYLTFQQASPYVTHMFGDQFLLRAAYARSDRDFEAETGRNSTSDEFQIDGFFLLDGARRYVVLGAKAGETEADDEAFSYDNAGLKARYQHRADAFGRELQFRLGAEFENRDFTGITEEIGARRKDELRSAAGGVIIPIAGPLSVDAGYEYRSRSSNLPAADYQAHIGTVQLKLNF